MNYGIADMTELGANAARAHVQRNVVVLGMNWGDEGGSSCYIQIGKIKDSNVTRLNFRMKHAALRAFVAASLISFHTIGSDLQSSADTSEPKTNWSSLTPDDIAFGEMQVKKMTSDRTKIGDYLVQGDPLWCWMARQFAGEFTGQRYSWTDHPVYNSPKRFVACHYYPVQGKIGWITVNDIDEKGYCLDGEQMLANAIFELINTRNDHKYRQLTLDALAGKVPKDQFVQANFRLEYLVRPQVSSFYREFICPLAASQGKQTHDRYWFTNFPVSYEDWVKLGQKPSLDPSFFDYFYEQEIAPRLNQ